MAESCRLYLVTDTNGGTEHLVDATHPSAAIKHVAPQFIAKIATQRDVARLLQAGVKIEIAAEST
jgi:hypothetical protein